MARKISLREFQQSVAQRLSNLSSTPTVTNKLGFQVGTDNWFVNLTDVSEIIPMAPFVPVPMTQSWFRGISNVRGKLYSITDFSAFQGQAPITPGVDRRVILIHEKLIEGAGLLVTRMLGLRNPEQFTQVEAGNDTNRPWMKAIYKDANGAPWHEIDLGILAHETRFLEVGNEGTVYK